MQVETMMLLKVHEAGPNSSYLRGLVLTTAYTHGANEDLKGHFERICCFRRASYGCHLQKCSNYSASTKRTCQARCLKGRWTFCTNYICNSVAETRELSFSAKRARNHEYATRPPFLRLPTYLPFFLFSSLRHITAG